MEQIPWYADGLRFGCTSCGHCCGGAPGNVFVSEAEMAALADLQGIDVETFCRRYTRPLRRGTVAYRSLIEQANHDCIFLDRQRACTVYQQRPQQCRTWPFWRSNLRDAESWHAAAQGCPGMGCGDSYEADVISRIAATDGLP